MVNTDKYYIEKKTQKVGDSNYVKKIRDLVELTEISNLIFKSELMDFLEDVEELENNMLTIDSSDFLDIISSQMSNFMKITLHTIDKVNKFDKKIKFIKRKAETNFETNLLEYVTPLEFSQLFPIYDPIKINNLIYSNREDIIDICISDYLGQRMVNRKALINYIFEQEEDFLTINNDNKLTLL